MKKLLALVLAIVAVSIIPLEAYAVDSNRKAETERIIEMYELYYPGCTIVTDDDGTMHVAIPYDYLSDLPSAEVNPKSSTARAQNYAPKKTPQSHYAPSGGIYKAYSDPNMLQYGTSMQDYWPIYVCFYGKDEAYSMLHFKNDEDVFNYIVKNYVEKQTEEAREKVIETIMTALEAKFGVIIPAAGIMLAVQLQVYKHVEWLNYSQFYTARKNSTSGKVYCGAQHLNSFWTPIVYTYSSWNSNYAVDPYADYYYDQKTYDVYGPAFYKGVYANTSPSSSYK